jgi:integrase
MALPPDLSNASRPKRLPTVLTHAEAMKIISHVRGVPRIMTKILYGSGLRIMECMRLRVRDMDFDYKTITVRDGKGEKDRVTPLPDALIPDLKTQIETVRVIHQMDLKEGYGVSRSFDPISKRTKRHHLDVTVVQKAVRHAARAVGMDKPVTPHTFRHSFATHLLHNGHDTQHLPFWAGVRTVQELLGHKDVKTTMIYTHVLKHGGLAAACAPGAKRSGVKSPLDT